MIVAGHVSWASWAQEALDRTSEELQAATAERAAALQHSSSLDRELQDVSMHLWLWPECQRCRSVVVA